MKHQFAMTNILTNQTVRGNQVKDSSKLRKKILINQLLCQVKDSSKSNCCGKDF